MGKGVVAFFLILIVILILIPLRLRLRARLRLRFSHNIIFHPNSPIEAGASGILKGGKPRQKIVTSQMGRRAYNESPPFVVKALADCLSSRVNASLRTWRYSPTPHHETPSQDQSAPTNTIDKRQRLRCPVLCFQIFVSGLRLRLCLYPHIYSASSGLFNFLAFNHSPFSLSYGSDSCVSDPNFLACLACLAGIFFISLFTNTPREQLPKISSSASSFFFCAIIGVDEIT